MVSIIGILSIYAATSSIKRLVRQWEQIRNCDPSNARDFPGITGGGTERNRFLGVFTSWALPLLLALIWSYLLRVSVELKVLIQGYALF
jgi:hypothetical protein